MTNNDNQLFAKHRTWEDWSIVFLGILIILMPWIATYNAAAIAGNEVAVSLNALVVGAALIFLGILEYAKLNRVMEIAVLLCGAWLFATPYILGFTAELDLSSWHYGLALATVMVAVLELWQDWNLNDDQMAGHGR